MRKVKPNYTKAIIIVHGKCELIMCQYIKNNLRLKMEILADKKGEKSIQINSLTNFLNKQGFKSLKQFNSKYDDIEREEDSSPKLKNFKIFTIMDTDDCTLEQAKAYQNKSMFKTQWFYEYIVPIYDSPDLDSILKKCDVLPNIKIHDKDKVKTYSKAFPIDKTYKKSDAIQLEEFANQLAKDKNTNLEEFLKYCLESVVDTR